MAKEIDISSELNTIAVDPHGNAVKMAVHDAIKKINDGAGGPRNNGPKPVILNVKGIQAYKPDHYLMLANDICASLVPGIIVKEIDLTHQSLRVLQWENRNANADDGTFVDNPDYRLVCIDFIEIPDDCNYNQIDMSGSYSSYQSYSFFYDADKKYLGCGSWRTANTEKNYIFPGAKYVRFGFRTPSNNTLSISNITECYANFFKETDEQIYDITSLTWDRKYGDDSDGTFYSTATNRLVCMDYISIPSGCTKVAISMFYATPSWSKYAYFYDANKKYIGLVDYNDAQSYTTIKSGAAYVRFGFKRSDDATLYTDRIRKCLAMFA